MEMCYDGALVMPSNYALMSEEEMTYLEGGSTSWVRGTAKTLKTRTNRYMLWYTTLFGGFSGTGAAAAATGVGVPLGVLAGFGAAYCGNVANLYRKAYNYYSSKSQTSSTLYKLTTIYTAQYFITGLSY